MAEEAFLTVGKRAIEFLSIKLICCVMSMQGLLYSSYTFAQQQTTFEFEFCGLEAARTASKRLGLRLSEDCFPELRRLKVASFFDLRCAFEDLGLRVDSYSVPHSDWVRVWWLKKILRRRWGEVIVLVRSRGNDLGASGDGSEQVGHYYLANSFDGTVMELLEPFTRQTEELKFLEIADQSGNLIFLHVYHPFSFSLVAPTSIEELLVFSPVLLLAAWTFFRRKTQSHSYYWVRFFFAGTCLVIGALSLTVGCHGRSSSDANSSGIMLTNQAVHFGDVLRNTQLKTEIVVKNKRDQRIHLDSLRLSCSCLKSDFSPRFLEPWGTTSFQVSLTAEGDGDQKFTGLVRSSTSEDFAPFSLDFAIVEGPTFETETFRLGVITETASQRNWSRRVQLHFKNLVAPIENSPISIQASQSSENLALTYGQVRDKLWTSDGTLEIDLQLQTAIAGSFCDEMDVVFQTSNGPAKVPIKFSGWVVEGE